MTHDFNPDLDLELKVDVPLTPEQLFQGWTDPDILPRWFCPRPWKVASCSIDLRPGGLFANVMQSPEGELMPENRGCYLWIDKSNRLIWTGLLGPNFRPNPPTPEGFGFVCDLSFTALPQGGSRFHAVVRHTDAPGKDRHAQMGFDAGWRMALQQLVELYGESTTGERAERD